MSPEESYFQTLDNLDVTGAELLVLLLCCGSTDFLQLRFLWHLLTAEEVGACKASPIKIG